jgi:hypothetical protein
MCKDVSVRQATLPRVDAGSTSAIYSTGDVATKKTGSVLQYVTEAMLRPLLSADGGGGGL